MEKDMCKDQHMQVDAEEKAVPEVHMQRNVENMAKMEEVISAEEDSDDSIDYSGAIPEIHFGHKKN